MGVSEYVWRNLSWRRGLVGRRVVDSLVAEAMHTPIRSGPDGEAAAAREIVARASRDGSLGAMVLAYILPYLAAEIVKLVLRWLDANGDRSFGGRIGGPHRPEIEG